MTLPFQVELFPAIMRRRPDGATDEHGNQREWGWVPAAGFGALPRLVSHNLCLPQWARYAEGHVKVSSC